jgi:tetratricopeptide (TPR) repeat protein
MIEQPDVPAGAKPPAPVEPPRPVRSQEVRASLEAVRVAREAAQIRARKQTMQARLWFAASLAALAGAGFVFAPRVSRWWHTRGHTPASAHAAARASQPAAAVAAAPAPPAASPIARPPSVVPAQPEPQASAAAPAPAPQQTAPAPAPQPTARAGDVASSAATAAATAEETCDMAAVRHAPWRLSPDACARAFDADPDNAALALGVAHASLVRGRFVDAAQWATRALSLDPKAAEAYVIIARAETANGRPDEAHTAYARYLELAPRGWHQAEARTAVQKGR